MGGTKYLRNDIKENYKNIANILLILIPIEFYTRLILSKSFLDIIFRYFGIIPKFLAIPLWIRMIIIILWMIIIVRYSSLFAKLPEKELIIISIIVTILTIVDAFAKKLTGYSFLHKIMSVSNDTLGCPIWFGILVIAVLVILIVKYNKVFVYTFDDKKN